MFDEKDRLSDSLVTQKYIISGYNMAATESANSQLMDAFMGILRDEHQINHDIFSEMNSRGWYQPKAANVNEVSQNIKMWNQDLQRVQNMAYRQPTAQQGISQASVQQYGFQTGVGLPQMSGETQSQPMYRPPQSPMI